MLGRMDATLQEERASALTHGVGALAALAGGAVLVALASVNGDGWQLAAAIVFSVCLLLLYIASTLYHAIQQPRAKSALKVFDHCAIYLLIAGTYTPFTLVGLRGEVGRNLFVAIWALAAAGIAFKLFFTGRFKLLSTVVYVAMGWLVLVAIHPVMQALDAWTFGWLLAGGAFYTLGTVFYHRSWSRAACATTSRCWRRCASRDVFTRTSLNCTQRTSPSFDRPPSMVGVS